MGKIYDLFYDNPEIAEAGIILTAVLLFYIFDKGFNISTWHLLIFVTFFLILGFLGIKYLRENKK